MMKNGFYVRAALPFVCTALLLTGCKTEGVSETQYVRLSDAACAFRGEGNSPLTIEVHANPAEWKAEALASWVEVTEVTATSFTVAVADNDSADTRKAEIAVRAGAAEQTIAVVQLAKDHVFPRYRCHPEFQYGTAMSPGGHYAGGFYSTAMSISIPLLSTWQPVHGRLWAPIRTACSVCSRRCVSAMPVNW